ncbi:Alpha-methylacyl-CoA racemase [Ralstonia solanacearum]|nr:Alpha-methylacyl-CoA racemase [Ralstonia solanacearum]
MAATDTKPTVTLSSTRSGWEVIVSYPSIEAAVDFLDENGVYEFELELPYSGNVMTVSRKFDRDAPVVPTDASEDGFGLRQSGEVAGPFSSKAA